VYIKETEETCDIVKRIILRIKRFFNIIKVEKTNNKIICYLPFFKGNKIPNYRIKRLVNKINILLEAEGSSNIALSEYLDNNQLLKNYLYNENVNILDGRYLFKCLIYKILEYLFRIKNKEMEFRRSFIVGQ